jgi:hypothetical protein
MASNPMPDPSPEQRAAVIAVGRAIDAMAKVEPDDAVCLLGAFILAVTERFPPQERRDILNRLCFLASMPEQADA